MDQTRRGISALMTFDPPVVAARVGRFYGDGLVWALGLPLPELIRWHDLIPTVLTGEARS